ncbi:phosphoacetylglucosamine mutase-like [Rhopilema esculentum]|uniref:phosphoacetylglucosamine mutase-like n=1 Tax=Rhopilema esculentum TaxID=499914 RepID=UPI0031DE150A|eukprot:gene12259-2900_t
MWQKVVASSKKYEGAQMKFTYGTAGFRQRASDLDSVLFKVGILSVLRSKAKCGKAIGVMITASHNPVQDNGVKLIDPMGEMLEASWEKYATALANASDDELGDVLQHIVSINNIDMNSPATVIVARDTRPSGNTLLLAFKEGVEAMGHTCRDFGLLTTPQLHYIVRCLNTNNEYGEPSEDGYYKKLSSAFKSLVSLAEKSTFSSIKLDGANGIGALKMNKMAPYLEGFGSLLGIFNDGSNGVLNQGCGADYVKVQQAAPVDFVYEVGDRCASFDGDADRIVYFFKDAENVFHLLDGDRIATLIAAYLKEKLDLAQIELSNGLGVVQTAYANGSSTQYLQTQMKVPVACTKTGVKHLHHKAQDFDIGVYFEANGHGTVLISEEAELKIRSAAKERSNDVEQKAAQCLSHFIDLTNQAIGDAISDMLIVECILNEKKWTCADWSKCYSDLPNKQSKVQVKDRTVIQTTDAERKVSSPESLQENIDQLVARVSNGRSFVRPSGTEDVVRIYAEAATKEEVDFLSTAVCRLVYDECGGVGTRP